MVRFFISIDGILFNFISTLYDLLIAISRTSILTQGDIASFATRIEILLGIFMLFKISFSLITYIVNPDDFSDKSKGFGKLIQNTVVSLVLLVITPYIFQMAFSLQAKILDDNTLAKLLLGEKITSEDTGDEEYNGKVTILDTAGNSMAFYVMLPFFTPRTSIDGLESCTVLYSGGKFNDECADAMKDLAGTSNSGENSDDENTVTSDEQYVDNYKYGIENESLGLTFRSTAALLTTGEGDSEQFLIDYKYILSTATAVIVCLLLITFCIDVGVRSVKLAFLQLIYPIPVISYMDPKSGNDGMFTKWYKMCLSTFLSLFIRLLALYFGIYIISKVGTMGMYDIINGSQITNGWVKIFVIIGILMFVKQMPKILENLGIKIDGDGKFNLNPLKKLEEGALGGKVLSRAPKAAAGAALGLGVGAVGAATGAGIGKGITGMFSGASGALKGKKLGEIHKGQVDANQRMREARANGSTFFGRQAARISGMTGSGGSISSVENEIRGYEKNKEKIESDIAPIKNAINRNKSVTDAISAMQDRAVSKIKQGKGAQGELYQRMLRDASAAEASGDGAKAEDIRQKAETYLNTTFRDAYISHAIANADFDSTLTSQYGTYKTVASIAGISSADQKVTGADLDSQLGEIKGKNSAAQDSIRERENKIAAIDDQIKDANVRKREASADKSALGK